MKSCPKCKLGSPDEATRCDCGYDFETKKLEKSYLVSADALSLEELSKVKSKANNWLAACLLTLFFHTLYLFYVLGDGSAPVFGILISILFVFFCCQYAVAKGYNWVWGLWGLVTFLGLALLVSKPYRKAPSRI